MYNNHVLTNNQKRIHTEKSSSDKTGLRAQTTMGIVPTHPSFLPSLLGRLDLSISNPRRRDDNDSATVALDSSRLDLRSGGGMWRLQPILA